MDGKCCSQKKTDGKCEKVSILCLSVMNFHRMNIHYRRSYYIKKKICDIFKAFTSVERLISSKDEVISSKELTTVMVKIDVNSKYIILSLVFVNLLSSLR